jgi:hypothetical protein
MGPPPEDVINEVVATRSRSEMGAAE